MTLRRVSVLAVVAAFLVAAHIVAATGSVVAIGPLPRMPYVPRPVVPVPSVELPRPAVPFVPASVPYPDPWAFYSPSRAIGVSVPVAAPTAIGVSPGTLSRVPRCPLGVRPLVVWAGQQIAWISCLPRASDSVPIVSPSRSVRPSIPRVAVPDQRARPAVPMPGGGWP